MKSKKLWAALFLLLGIFLAYRLTRKPEAAAEFTPVTVTRGNIELSVSATGVVQPRNRLEVKPPIGGRVESVLAREGNVVRRGQVLAWMSSTERAALLDAARAKGPEELAHWEEMYKPAPLSAPSDGVVIARRVEPGQTVTAQDALFVISDKLIVKAQVDETDIGRIKPAQRARIVPDAYADHAIGGGVEHVAYEAKTVNNVTIYDVDVLPDAVPDFMRSGMTADVIFLISRKEDVLLLPAEAVRSGKGKGRGGEENVLVPSDQKDGRPRPVKVRTGLTDGKMTEIVEGLSEGDAVLIPSFVLPQASGGENPFMPSARPRGGRRTQ